MQPSPRSISPSPPSLAGAMPHTNLSADRAYQGVTVLAMLLILGSLVLFW